MLFFNTKCSTTNAPIKILKSTQCKVLFLNSFFKFDFKKSFCENVKKEMEIVINKELTGLENGLNFLASVGSTAPFIGLFGTVWGIMNSFQSIAISRNTSLAIVAPGIAEALFATALGLLAAIPAVIAYNKFNSDSQRYFARVDNFSKRFLSII